MACGSLRSLVTSSMTELSGDIAVERGAPPVRERDGATQALVAEGGHILAGDIESVLSLGGTGLEEAEHTLQDGHDVRAVAGGEPPQVLLHLAVDDPVVTWQGAGARLHAPPFRLVPDEPGHEVGHGPFPSVCVV